jgi:hypothetical protein
MASLSMLPKGENLKLRDDIFDPIDLLARCSSQSVRRQRPGALARCGARHLGVQGVAACLKSQWSRASATSAMGHFETKTDALSMRVYRSGPPA